MPNREHPCFWTRFTRKGFVTGGIPAELLDVGEIRGRFENKALGLIELKLTQLPN